MTQQAERYLSWGEEPVAVAAFRVLLFFSGSIGEGENATTARKLYDLAVERLGSGVAKYSLNRGGAQRNFRKFGGATKVPPESFFESEIGYGHAVRLYGASAPDFTPPGPPYLNVEQGLAVFWTEMAIEADAPDLAGLATAIAEIASRGALLSGAMGFGYFLPPRFDSVNRVLASAMEPARAALLLTPGMLDSGVVPGSYLDDWAGGAPPGIADLGWATLLGPDFVGRVADGLRDLRRIPGVALEDVGDGVLIRLGDAPIWGREGDDLALYRAAARALQPVRMPDAVAQNLYFGNFDPEAGVAYLRRFDR